MLRALTLVDVLAQLQQDSSSEVPFDANEVVNQLIAGQETLHLTSDTWALATATNYPLNIIQDAGPLAYWRLDDPLSSTTVADSSPWATATYPKLPGTVNGTITFQVAGAMTGSKAATFNGSTGYVEATGTSSLQRVGDLTLELWLKPASLAAASALISKGTTGEYHLRLNTNGSVDFLMGPAFSATVVPAASITTGTWYHLVVVRTAIGKTLAAYLNGSSTFSGTYTTAPSATSNPVRVAATSPGTATNFFNGTLDEVAIYARTLTATQAANHRAWALAADCTSTPYGVGKYGYMPWPLPGSAAGSIYGDPSTLYGSFSWQ